MNNPSQPGILPDERSRDASVPSGQRTASLGAAGTSGALYFLSQTVVGKVANFLGQIVLAWFLTPDDFGRASLALGVAFFANTLQRAGVAEVLVQRAANFSHWSNAGFWLSFTIGTATSLAMVGLAPFVASFYNDPGVKGLVLILSTQVFLNALATVPAAQLQVQLRFRVLAAFGLLASVATVGLSVTFAGLGFGVLALILPLPIIEAVRTVCFWLIARPALRFTPEISRWRYMVGDSVLLLVSGILVAIPWQLDYVILGILYDDKSVVGMYFWSRNLSTQTLQLLSINVAAILLPSLALMREQPVRQLAAFKRAASILTLIAIPACVLQAAIAAPFITLVFGEKWQAGARLVQVFSIGWALMTTSHAAISMLKAQGRNGWLIIYAIASAVAFAGLVWVATTVVGGALGAAYGMLIYAWSSGPVLVYLALVGSGGTWRDVRDILQAPLLSALVAFGFALLITAAIPELLGSHGRFVAMLGMVLVMLLTYATLLRYFAPGAWISLWSFLRGVFGPVGIKFR